MCVVRDKAALNKKLDAQAAASRALEAQVKQLTDQGSRDETQRALLESTQVELEETVRAKTAELEALEASTPALTQTELTALEAERDAAN